MAAKDIFLDACSQVGWVIPPSNDSLEDLAEHLFDHAGRGSDPWAVVMARVRAAVMYAEADDAPSTLVSIQEADERAHAFNIPVPGEV